LRSDRSESRALTSASGTPAARDTATRFGHSSVSTTMPRAGRQARRKRRIAKGWSQGSKAWDTRGAGPLPPADASGDPIAPRAGAISAPNSSRPVSRPVGVMWVSSSR